MNKPTKGISFLNPVRVEGEYLKRCARYAIEHGIKHFELIGPTHDPVRGNCDGMMLFRKYAEFNDGKDVEYIKYCEKELNEALDMVDAHGIKSYYWHHELEVPAKFDELYPEVLNERGDVEVTHPLIKDFLVNKIEDFFYTYPKMSGIVLTLHETRIPLLKLKNQKIGKIERVKYVTEIVYETCKKLGKELIVRPFASIAQDYDDLMTAYEQISSDLTVNDKWTKYDWSLVRPHNPFLARIKNPLVIEADIYEYFGKGFIPLMLKKHITEKVKYCSQYNPRGYVLRIDRGGYTPFDTPNEVNLEIMDAALDGRDVDEAIDAFFRREYGEYGDIVRSVMEDTEDLQVKALHAEGRALHWLSLFPPLFVMKGAYRIFRDDFVMPESMKEDGFKQFRIDVVLADKREAIAEIGKKLAIVESLKGKLDENKYYQLWMRFKNFDIVAKIFEQLCIVYYSIARYFEHHEEDALAKIYEAIDIMRELDREGFEALGPKDFHCEALSIKKGAAFRRYGLGSDSTDPRDSHVYLLDQLLKPALDMEVAKDRELRAENPADYVIPGGFSEEHSIKSEPNFSAALTMPDGPCRTAGSQRGSMWSVVKAHGWFSYEMKVNPGVENTVTIEGKGEGGNLSFDLTIDGEMTRHSASGEGLLKISHTFTPAPGADKVTVRIDRNSAYLPFIYSVMIK